MEMLINAELVKKIRHQRSWSQDQLAVVAGLSLRTVQRVENNAVCSLETKRALASAFELDAHDLDVPETTVKEAGQRRVFAFALTGVVLGLILAGVGLWLDFGGGLARDSIDGLTFGLAGAAAGILFGIAGILVRPKN